MARKAVLIAFSAKSGKFESNSERTKFFKALYGWEQIILKENKKYTYERKGVLDKVPHERVDQSSFIIPENNFEKIADFFEEWSKKVIWKTFKVLLEENEFESMFEGFDEDLEEEEEVEE